MANSNKEALFLTELKHSFREQVKNVFWYKIKDTPASVHASGAMRFDTPKPFDVLAVINGIPIAIEAKYMSDYQAFGKRHLRPAQVIGLEAFINGGGHSYIVLNIRKPREVNRVIIFNWLDFKKLDKSIGKNQLQQCEYIEGIKGRYPVKQMAAHMELGL